MVLAYKAKDRDLMGLENASQSLHANSLLPLSIVSGLVVFEPMLKRGRAFKVALQAKGYGC